MTVDKDIAFVVTQTDPLTKATSRASINHGGIDHSTLRSSQCVGDVNTLVELAPSHLETSGQHTFGGLHNGRHASCFVCFDASLIESNSLLDLRIEVNNLLLRREAQDLRRIGDSFFDIRKFRSFRLSLGGLNLICSQSDGGVATGSGGTSNTGGRYRTDGRCHRDNALSV